MGTWPFIAYSAIFLALVCAHFVAAYQAWKVSREEVPSDIDPNYVRMEDYFARSFRVKVAEWLQLPVQSALADGTQLIQKGSEYIRVSAHSVEHEPQIQSDEIQVVKGSFVCAAGCVFHREIYAYEDAFIGAGTRLQAIAADGDLNIGFRSQVTRWADCAGEMEIGAEAIVRARATAGKTIHLKMGARAGSVFAPTVSTAFKGLENLSRVDEPAVPMFEIAGPGGQNIPARRPENLGLDPKRLSPLGSDCLSYSGDLSPRVPFRLKTKLIVKGNCELPPGTVLEEDLKADGRIMVGELSICKGNLIAGSDIWLGPSSRFQGVIHAGGMLGLSRGTCGGSEGQKVAAFAAEKLLVEEEVTVYGKLSSADRVEVVEDARPRYLWAKDLKRRMV